MAHQQGDPASNQPGTQMSQSAAEKHRQLLRNEIEKLSGLERLRAEQQFESGKNDL